MKNFLKKLFSSRNTRLKDGKSYKHITILGIDLFFRNKNKDIENELKLLRTILEKSIDITKIPKATGNFRKVQLIKTKILKIIDIVFKKNNITYWIDYGTLIGAIRHKGFIPWDDDIDIEIFKEDYIKLPEIFKRDLEPLGFNISYCHSIGSTLIRLSYKGFEIDFFPMEYINSRCNSKKECDEFIEKWFKLKKALFKNYPIQDFIDGKINHLDLMPKAEKLKKEIIDKNYFENKETNQIVRSVETMYLVKRWGINDTKYLFPLQEIQFEDLTLPAPCDPIYHLYEINCYGEYGSVMNFPTIIDDGFFHTQNQYENADTDFDEILSELDNITEEHFKQ